MPVNQRFVASDPPPPPRSPFLGRTALVERGDPEIDPQAVMCR